jgi:hypothetical protein
MEQRSVSLAVLITPWLGTQTATGRLVIRYSPARNNGQSSDSVASK